jgi:hypothetical protein
MSGPVERAVRDHVAAGDRLPTPTGTATFVVHELRDDELVLLLGEKQAWTPLSWECLEHIVEFLRGRDWVPIGANRLLPGDRATLDGYMKGCLKRQTANYVAVVLERAGLVELDRERPARVRLRRAWA